MINIPRDKLPLSLSHRGQMQCATGRYVDMDDDKADIMKYAVKAANEFPEAIDILKTLKEDAEMALDGNWNKSDSGFEAQIELIDRYLNKLKDGRNQ